jgi:hypothetical protein
MAIEHDWAPDSVGAHAQTGAYEPAAKAAAKAADTFKPIQPKQFSPADTEQHVQNVVGSVQSATPSERRGGTRWYAKAHRDARTLAAGANPRNPGRTRRDAMKSFSALPHEEQESRTRQQAGAIARLSPSGGGMNWERNVPAVHELNQMSNKQVDQVRAGNRSSLAGKNLRFASNRDIGSAHTLVTGENKPESVLPMELKTGHFYENIATGGKSGGSTVDARSHDIALGERHSWDTNRGLQTKGRYAYLDNVHAEAGKRLGMTPAATQATSWVADKRKAVESGQGLAGDSGTKGQKPVKRGGSTL